MKSDLKERLKFWHIYCLNCGNKVVEIEKTEKEYLKKTECSDCKDKIEIHIGRTGLKLGMIFNHNKQLTIIGCEFNIKFCKTCLNK